MEHVARSVFLFKRF